MNLVEWAEENRRLSPESSSTPGKFVTANVEVARGPMLEATNPATHTIDIMCCTQLMKALDVNTLLPTPTGWVTMDDVKSGDKLFDENGNVCNVLGVTDTMTRDRCLEVTFSDGAKIVCDDGHKWTLDDQARGLKTKKSVTITAEELLRTFKKEGRNRYAIPVAKPLILPEADLPIPPYALGVWLGDGNKKHIPVAYLRASVEQRTELLQGLMDTDGTIAVEGRPSFCTINKDFADQFLELLASLGFKGRIYQVNATCNGKDCGFAYNVSFMAYSDTPVFKLDRKRDRQVSQLGRRVSEVKRRRVVNVEAIPARPVKCLAVDSESHLYLCGKEMIPTHNTELLNNYIGFHIDQDPAPMMLIQPTAKLGDDWSKDRFDTMRRDTPAIKARVKEARSKDSKTTLSHKDFDGGHLTIVGSNSPTDLASRPIRIVLADEIDKYPLSAGREGSPLKLAEERADSFWNRMFIRTCSPTIAGASLIESEYLSSDQRKPFVKCVHCDFEQVLEFERVRWDKTPDGVHLTDSAKYHCIECDKPWDEKYRQRVLKTKDAVRWKQTAPFSCCGNEQTPNEWNSDGRSKCGECGELSAYNGHAGFWASKLYSPWSGLDRVAAKWIAAVKSNDNEALKVFYNTQLGQSFQLQGEAPEWKRLYDRRDRYHFCTAPMGALVLTAGIDIQRDRIEMHVWGWGRGMESWLIDVLVFEGATADIKSPAWDHLKTALTKLYPHEAGSDLKIFRAAVDTGDGVTTSVVYEWCRQQGQGQVFAIKGDREKFNATSPLDGPRLVDVLANGRKLKRGLKLWLVSGPVFKSELYRHLNLEKPTDEDISVGVVFPDGYVHLPEEVTGEWVEQLVAETLVTEKNKSGFSRLKWKKTRERNEALDCRVYARSMAWGMGMDRWTSDVWSRLEAQLGTNTEEAKVSQVANSITPTKPEPEKPREQPANDNTPKKAVAKKRRSSFL